jgi:hypothetical protein
VATTEQQTGSGAVDQVLFPMAVGVVFLAMLVLGALFG